MLTDNWVNTMFALVSAGLLFWGWRMSRREARYRGWPAAPGSFADAYSLPPHAFHNRAEIEDSDWCGCLCCEQMYRPMEIEHWQRDAAGDTAICPRCRRTAVVGSGAGFVLTPELVHRAHMVRFPARGRLIS